MTSVRFSKSMTAELQPRPLKTLLRNWLRSTSWLTRTKRWVNCAQQPILFQHPAFMCYHKEFTLSWQKLFPPLFFLNEVTCVSIWQYMVTEVVFVCLIIPINRKELQQCKFVEIKFCLNCRINVNTHRKCAHSIGSEWIRINAESYEMLRLPLLLTIFFHLQISS